MAHSDAFKAAAERRNGFGLEAPPGALALQPSPHLALGLEGQNHLAPGGKESGGRQMCEQGCGVSGRDVCIAHDKVRRLCRPQGTPNRIVGVGVQTDEPTKVHDARSARDLGFQIAWVDGDHSACMPRQQIGPPARARADVDACGTPCRVRQRASKARLLMEHFRQLVKRAAHRELGTALVQCIRGVPMAELLGGAEGRFEGVCRGTPRRHRLTVVKVGGSEASAHVEGERLSGGHET